MPFMASEEGRIGLQRGAPMAIQAQAVSSKRIYKQTTLNGCIYRYTDVHVTVIEDVLMHVRGHGAT